jgi:hypothetical protein
MYLGWCLAGASVLLGAALRVAREGQRELAASDAAWSAGDSLGATVHARAAARAYVPFAPHVAAAYRRLRAVAQDSEGRGDVESALFAWRAVRAAAIGSRSILTAHERQREVADAAIARLSAAPRPRGAPDLRGEPEVTSSQAAALAASLPPRAPWGFVLIAGAAMWVMAGVRIASPRADDVQLTWSTLRIPLVMAGLGLVAWWVALFAA